MSDMTEPPFNSPHTELPNAAKNPPECERCGGVMYDRHCKVVCPNCGYLRDCSDP